MALANRSVKRYQLNDGGEREADGPTVLLPSVLGQENATSPGDPLTIQHQVDVAVEQLTTNPSDTPTIPIEPVQATQAQRVVSKQPTILTQKPQPPLAPLSSRLADAIRESPVMDPSSQKGLEKLVSWKKAVVVVVLMLFVGFLSGALVVILLL